MAITDRIGKADCAAGYLDCRIDDSLHRDVVEDPPTGGVLHRDTKRAGRTCRHDIDAILGEILIAPGGWDITLREHGLAAPGDGQAFGLAERIVGIGGPELNVVGNTGHGLNRLAERSRRLVKTGRRPCPDTLHSGMLFACQYEAAVTQSTEPRLKTAIADAFCCRDRAGVVLRDAP